MDGLGGEERVYIYLIGEAETRTLIKAYIQHTQHAIASARVVESF